MEISHRESPLSSSYLALKRTSPFYLSRFRSGDTLKAKTFWLVLSNFTALFRFLIYSLTGSVLQKPKALRLPLPNACSQLVPPSVRHDELDTYSSNGALTSCGSCGVQRVHVPKVILVTPPFRTLLPLNFQRLQWNSDGESNQLAASGVWAPLPWGDHRSCHISSIDAVHRLPTHGRARP